MPNIRARVKRAAQTVLSRREYYATTSKPYIDKALTYAKENPSEILLGIMTLLLMDIESDVDDLEAHTGLSAAVDYHTFTTTK
jgi:hypothetical protein